MTLGVASDLIPPNRNGYFPLLRRAALQQGRFKRSFPGGHPGDAFPAGSGVTSNVRVKDGRLPCPTISLYCGTA
jgi:hypothetical protein